jgi:hypothetical protein
MSAVAFCRAGAAAVLLVVAIATPAGAATIVVPSSRNLGSVAAGASTLSAQLGTVTVTASGLVAPSFVATVSATAFKTGAGGVSQTISTSSIRYWSGPATAVVGLLGGGTPGQPTVAQAQNLSVARTAFSGSGALLSISASWNPTIIIDIPAAAVAGVYSGTITHSVA